MVRRTLYTAVGVIATLALFVAPAAATSEPVTKITLTLTGTSVPVGSNVSGSVLVMSGSGKKAAPLSGASLGVSVDGVPVATTTTNGSGLALVDVPAVTPGSHQMRVEYAGDASHKKAQDVAMFTATSADPTATTTTPAPEPTTTTTQPPDPTTTTSPPDPTSTTTSPPPDPTMTTTTTPPPDPTTTTPPTGPPPDPPGIVLLQSPLSGYVYLQWSVPADNGSEIIRYNIYRGLTSNGETFLRSRSVEFDFADDFDVIPGVTYYYVVTAVNANGESAWSTEASVIAN